MDPTTSRAIAVVGSTDDLERVRARAVAVHDRDVDVHLVPAPSAAYLTAAPTRRVVGSVAGMVFLVDAGRLAYRVRPPMVRSPVTATSVAVLHATADLLGAATSCLPVAVELTRPGAIAAAMPYDYRFERTPPVAADAWTAHTALVDAELRWVLANWVDEAPLLGAIARFDRATLHASARLDSLRSVALRLDERTTRRS